MDAKSLNKLKIITQDVNFRNIEEAEINPQEMNQQDFNRLTKNIKRDGIMTSTPLLMRQKDSNKYRCISGHHRIKAAIKAGILHSDCQIIDEVDESTRLRLQLSHNDIHGEPDKSLTSILLNKMVEVDLSLVDTSDFDREKKEAENYDYEIPIFKHIEITLLETSRDSLIQIIDSFGNSDSVKWLIEKEQYDNVKDLLTLAFRKGFKTPGQAFGKFLDIVKENVDKIER